MKSPVLVLLAAGMASRYGGAKQIDPVDSRGNVIMDYSVYDAARAGFRDIVFIIRPEHERDMRDDIIPKMQNAVNVRLAYQTLDRLPEGYVLPDERAKPWGTTHAVLCARGHIGGAPFAVLNADDLYGAEAFNKIYNFLVTNNDPCVHAMAGYRIENTLSDNGTVKRGICRTEGDELTACVETFGLLPKEGGAIDGEGVFYPAGTVVSMNFWGFMPSMLDELDADFRRFLDTEAVADPLNSECLLPDTPGRLALSGQAHVRVLEVSDKWLGVTYKEDMPAVRKAVDELIAGGVYPERLF